ncbi:hypothetical protein [Vibrio sp. B1Z05]|uniref:hypothetical protein n=1 Tax=Vibrio sp. B1Z05 TaxID=2654980 RepID=UPI00128D3451|nr:hypothetical protein [Vibrio sp. B1Z05]MPW37300.1 hypothetical protein [Vibrio sp. B1Z05]
MSNYIDLEVLDATYVYLNFTSHNGESGTYEQISQLDISVPVFSIDNEVVNKISLKFFRSGTERRENNFVVGNTLYHQLSSQQIDHWLNAIKLKEVRLLVPKVLKDRWTSDSIGIYGDPR